MQRDTDVVRAYYDENAQMEWERMDWHPFEFCITTEMMKRHVKPGDRILDIGGGPGRYAIHFAQFGCNVDLVDLSPGNIALAKVKAAEAGVEVPAFVGDAREVDKLVDEKLAGACYDHVFLMGPLYHLTREEDQMAAVESAMKCLKPGGIIYISFLPPHAGMIDCMKNVPEAVLDPENDVFFQAIYDWKGLQGDGFTRVNMMQEQEIEDLMAKFPLEKLHLFGQEGVMAPCENVLKEQPADVQEGWIEASLKLCEHPQFYVYSEHLMFVGKKV